MVPGGMLGCMRNGCANASGAPINVDVTGTFDGHTKKAIESFQKQLKTQKDGLGVAGPKTLGKLAQ